MILIEMDLMCSLFILNPIYNNYVHQKQNQFHTNEKNNSVNRCPRHKPH